MRLKPFILAGCACLLTAGALLFSACSPDEAQDERLHKDHGDPAKAYLTIEPGVVTNGLFKANAANTAGTSALNRQTIVYGYQSGKGWAPLNSAAKQLYVVAGTAYSLQIRYEDAHGQDITYQFATNGQDKIHQHFFQAKGVTPILGDGTITAEEEKTPVQFAYHYADTNPWNAEQDGTGSNVTGENPLTGELINPIGMKGWMQFHKPHRKMLMQIDLMHAAVSKITNKGISPYYAPTKGQILSDHWDLQMKIPVVVFASATEQANYRE